LESDSPSPERARRVEKPDSVPSRTLLPAAGIPWLYFAFAHVCLAIALGILALRPTLPGPFFLHPRMAALAHLVTLGWISGSIFGAFYFVAPLTMRMPLRPGWADRVAFVCYVVGVAIVVSQFWSGDYERMAWAAVLVLLAALHVSVRAAVRLPGALGGWPVKLHIALAFANLLAATIFGIVVGLNRTHAWIRWSPLSAAYAHLHIAIVGWATMMFVGLAYRLIPMIVPTAMPKGASIASSAILIESGLALLVNSLMAGSAWTAAGALLIVAGLVSFVMHVRLALKDKLPPPAALPRPDYATWQTHVALLWLVTAAALGLLLSLGGTGGWRVTAGWWYGAAGLIGFLAQVIAGMQGRLVPMYAWYGAFEARGHTPPPIAAHALASHSVARWIFITWAAGVPALALGLAAEWPAVIVTGSLTMLAGVILNAWQLGRTYVRARR
jgi:hypothetical protein